MNYYEFITLNDSLSFRDAIKVLVPIYVNAHNWNVDDSIADVNERKIKYILNQVLLGGINSKRISGRIIYSKAYFSDGFPVIDDKTNDHVEDLNYVESKVDVKSLIEFILDDLKDKAYIPNDLLKHIGIEVNDGLNLAEDDVYEDNISDETIAKYKELPLPQMKKKVVELAKEKIKWDLSLQAAAKIGLLFYEKGLKIPTTEKEFKEEFKNNLEVLGKLPSTTITRIYNAIPSMPYKNLGGQEEAEAPTLDDDTLDTIINASVAAGIICCEDEVKDARDLENKLTRMEMEIPPPQFLGTISGACKRVFKKYRAQQI